MRLYSQEQYYPDHQGRKLKSWAIWLKRDWWRRREFVGYCFNRARAYQAMCLIVKTMGWRVGQ